jgi:hypothetical protein
MWYGYDGGQRQLQTTQRGLWLVFKWACKALIYASLLVTGYLICTLFLDKKAHGLLWLGLPVLLAYLLYIVVMATKKIINSLRAKGKLFWLPLFILCVAFTCVLPACIVYNPVNYIVHECKGNQTVTILLVACFTCFVYFQYDFLNRRQRKKLK